MYYCLHCLTGKESELSAEVERRLKILGFDDIIIWFPKKRSRTKVKHVVHEELKPLFPGYIFLYFGYQEKRLPSFDINRIPGIIRFLTYGDGTRALRGSDLSVAKWIHRFDGEFAISKVVFKTGERLHIVEGPMQGMDAMVTKVDRHKKKIWVNFDLDGVLNNVSFDVDFIEGGGAVKTPD